MSKYFVWMIILGVMLGVGCQREPAPTAVPEAVVEEAVPTAELPTATPLPAPTDTPLPPPPTAAEPSPTEEPTAAAVVEEEDVAPVAEPTATETAVVAEPPTIIAGTQQGGSLTGGAFDSYIYQGTAFQPVLLFVEGSSTIDLGILAYEGEVTAATDLSERTPRTQADFSNEGGPEIMVLTPAQDGPMSVVVTAFGDGNYVLHMFDVQVALEGLTYPQAGTLTAGQTAVFPVDSIGSRPVLIFVDPAEQADLAIKVTDTAGTVLNEADFGGGGSAEALFVLPLQTTSYQVQVSEVTGSVADYRLTIVTLQ